MRKSYSRKILLCQLIPPSSPFPTHKKSRSDSLWYIFWRYVKRAVFSTSPRYIRADQKLNKFFEIPFVFCLKCFEMVNSIIWLIAYIIWSHEILCCITRRTLNWWYFSSDKIIEKAFITKVFISSFSVTFFASPRTKAMKVIVVVLFLVSFFNYILCFSFGGFSPLRLPISCISL